MLPADSPGWQVQIQVHDPDPEVAMAALDALTFPRKFMMDEGDLLRLLRRPEPELRLRLIEYIDATRHPGRRDLLLRLLTDPSEEVRDRARVELEEEKEEDP